MESVPREDTTERSGQTGHDAIFEAYLAKRADFAKEFAGESACSLFKGSDAHSTV